MKNEYKYRINTNFNRKVQEQNFGGEKYTSFNPGVSISVGVDDTDNPQDIKEIAEELYMIARHVVEEAIEQRKQEIKGDSTEEDFLADAQKAWKRMGERNDTEIEWDYPDHVDPPLKDSNS